MSNEPKDPILAGLIASIVVSILFSLFLLPPRDWPEISESLSQILERKVDEVPDERSAFLNWDSRYSELWKDFEFLTPNPITSQDSGSDPLSIQVGIRINRCLAQSMKPGPLQHPIEREIR